MTVRHQPRPSDTDASAAEASSLSARILAKVRAEGRMMTREERVAFFDDIRSRSIPTDEDSADLIRRDRDER